LALIAIKFKFNSLIVSITNQLMQNIDNCLHFETVDDLYGIAKSANNKELIEKCSHFMDKYGFHLKDLFLWEDIQEIVDKNFITLAFDKSLYNNYIHFLLPDFMEMCFKVFVSTDRYNWRLVLNKENIYRNS
jgi:hypothetical protein